MTNDLTRRLVRERLNAAGMTIRYSADFSEYRVDFAGAGPDDVTAYYTLDLDDALATGLDMARRRFGGPAEGET